MSNAHSLHEAVQIGDLDRVKALLSVSPDLVISKDWNEDTPLHIAAYFGYGDIVELLLNHQVDVNAKNSHGKTPLHRATFNGHKDVVNLLLTHGAIVNAKDNYGDTPLCEAMTYGYAEIADTLRQHGGME